MEMLKLCHHICFTQKNNRNVLSTICDSIYIVDIVTFITRPWRVFVTGNSEKLTVISLQLMSKLLDTLLTKEPVLLQGSLCYCSL